MKEPKIRFKGFRGEWEKKKLGAMTSVRGGYAFQSSLFQKSGIPVVRISNILSNGNVGGDFAYYPQLDGDTNITIHEKDVVIAMSGATTGKIARVDVGDGILYQNQRVGLFTKTGKVDYDFLYTVLNRPHFNELLNKLLTSSAQPNASSADIESIEMEFPEDAEEQKALSNYILSLDSLIQSTTKKIESLKQVKAASLQAMFPQEGETTPRVRFKGFEGEWEKVNFGQLGSVAMCKRIFKDQTQEKGDVPFFKIGTFGMVPDAYISKELYEEYKSKFSFPQKGDILISAAGTIGRTIQYNGEDAYFQDSNIVWLKHGNEIDNTFLKYIYSTVKWNGLEGATIKRLYNNIILETEFLLPTKAEQQKIADYFNNLDRQIALQGQRLEKLKQIKAACLDKMFV